MVPKSDFKLIGCRTNILDITLLLAMGIIDKKAMSGNIKPNLWWTYRDDIFDLRTLGHVKLLEFTQYINSLYPTIKFTLVHSPTSLAVLDLALSFVEGYIQTDIIF